MSAKIYSLTIQSDREIEVVSLDGTGYDKRFGFAYVKRMDRGKRDNLFLPFSYYLQNKEPRSFDETMEAVKLSADALTERRYLDGIERNGTKFLGRIVEYVHTIHIMGVKKKMVIKGRVDELKNDTSTEIVVSDMTYRVDGVTKRVPIVMEEEAKKLLIDQA